MDLLDASETGDIEKVKQLLNSGADVNTKDIWGYTPLHFESIRGHLDTVKLLLHHGAEINFKNNYGSTPLHFASIRGHLDTVKLLLQHKADVNIKNNDGNTPLHVASLDRHLEIAKELLQNGAEINIKNNNENTSLHYATLSGHLDTVKLLLHHKADVNIKNNDGNTPLSCFLKNWKISDYYANELFTYIFLFSKKLQTKYFGTNCLLSIFESLLSLENLYFLELYYEQKDILNIIIHIATEEKYKSDRNIPDFKNAVIEYTKRKLNL